MKYLLLMTLALGTGFASAQDAPPPAGGDVVKVEALKLKDGRELIGIYDAEKSQLKTVDKKTGKVIGSMYVSADNIVERTAITIEVAAQKPKATPGTGGEWIESFPDAVKAAQASGRPILIDFTGSDWCGWCIKLHKEVFDTAEFKEWAAKNVVLMEADFPNKKAQAAATKKQNEEMQRKYAIDGFPTIVVIDASGKELARSGYLDGGPKAWITDLEGRLKR
jgi:protein disulfide-isomerase